MEKMIDTYGKTWHTWHTDQALSLPLGRPWLMMGFTGDGQVNETMVAERDERLGIRFAVVTVTRAAKLTGGPSCVGQRDAQRVGFAARSPGTPCA